MKEKSPQVSEERLGTWGGYQGKGVSPQVGDPIGFFFFFWLGSAEMAPGMLKTSFPIDDGEVQLLPPKSSTVFRVFWNKVGGKKAKNLSG